MQNVVPQTYLIFEGSADGCFGKALSSMTYRMTPRRPQYTGKLARLPASRMITNTCVERLKKAEGIEGVRLMARAYAHTLSAP